MMRKQVILKNIMLIKNGGSIEVITKSTTLTKDQVERIKKQ